MMPAGLITLEDVHVVLYCGDDPEGDPGVE